MSQSQALLERAHKGLQLHISGHHSQAKEHLLQLWEELSSGRDPLIRCTVAHYMANLQGGDTEASLGWNKAALSEIQRLADPNGLDPAIGVSPKDVYPSLYLNLAEDYRRLGELLDARAYLDRSRQALEELDPYRRQAGVSEAIKGVERRIQETGQESRLNGED